MPVSILVPAYNEQRSIVAALRSLLTSQFVEFEIVVVNDGSDGRDPGGADRRLRAGQGRPGAALQHPDPAGPRRLHQPAGAAGRRHRQGQRRQGRRAQRRHQPRGLPALLRDRRRHHARRRRSLAPGLGVPGGAGDGRRRRHRPHRQRLDASRTGACSEVRTPRNLLANLQIIEYLRAFLGGRIGWSKSGMLLIISGAFGLFRRDVCVEVGGYDPTTVGEDAELVLRLHRHRRDQGKPCRITFFPDPICWTECPEDLRTLMRQRDRWQRGLIEMIARHREMLLRPRYGRIGCLAMPYFIVFELLGPTIECFGYAHVRAGAGPRRRLAAVRARLLRRLADLRPGPQLPGDPDGGARLPPLSRLERPAAADPLRRGRELRLPPAAGAGADALLVHAGTSQAATGAR